MNKIKVTHIITCLDTGGAEMMLYKLLSLYDRNKFVMSVISLSDIGEIGKKIQAIGVPIESLNLRKNFFNFFKLIKILRKNKPNIIQTWMYHADLFGAVASLFVKKVKLVWGIRNGSIDKNRMKCRTIFTAKICAWLSKFIPKKIICCAHAAADIHVKFGYAKSKMIVIPNGFDLKSFKFNSEFYQDVRKELQLSGDSLLVGMLARFDPDKDYSTFIKASHQVALQNPKTYFVCCGKNIDQENLKLFQQIKNFSLQDRFYLLGERYDIPRLLSAFDVLASSSVSEGFSNVIGEAMACETPCVVTDVGDSAAIVGNNDFVVPPQEVQKLSEAIQKILSMGIKERKMLGKKMRDRIDKNYSINVIIDQYQDLYTSCVLS